jgi:hypothetical protein
MKQTILALALLLATPLTGLAAPPKEPAPLTGPTMPLDGPPATLALCAALPTTGAPQVRPEQASELSLVSAVVTCSSYCGHPQCLGFSAGFPCLAGPGKAGNCSPATTYCSTDGLHSCACKWLPER